MMWHKNKQAKQKKVSSRFSLERFVSFHWQALQLSFHQLRQTSLATFMTASVIGVALALPAVFFVLLQNAGFITTGLEKGTQISLFLSQPEEAKASMPVDELMAKIRVLPEVANVHYISPEEGLHDLENQEGLSGVLEQLNANPLPPVLEVYPAENINTPQQTQHLLDVLKVLPGVESVKLDMLWVKRLHAILAFGERGVLALGTLLAIAVILVINHTIRLSTQNRHKEINVLGLIGATHAFTRRPFLYTGMLYGVAGGFLAWIFVEIFVLCLSFPVDNLSELYHTHFELHGLGFVGGTNLLVLGLFLGWLGSWSAVNRCIKLTPCSTFLNDI